MKKIHFLSLVLICIIAASSIIFTKAFCEEDDSAFDALCNNSSYFRYNELFRSILFQTGLLYENSNEDFSQQKIILYLERQEKSPPLNPPILQIH